MCILLRNMLFISCVHQRTEIELINESMLIRKIVLTNNRSYWVLTQFIEIHFYWALCVLKKFMFHTLNHVVENSSKTRLHHLSLTENSHRFVSKSWGYKFSAKLKLSSPSPKSWFLSPEGFQSNPKNKQFPIVWIGLTLCCDRPPSRSHSQLVIHSSFKGYVSWTLNGPELWHSCILVCCKSYLK